MRYPALKLLMVLHYVLALVVGWVAFVYTDKRADGWMASAVAVVATLGIMALADLIRLLVDIEASSRFLRSAGSAATAGSDAAATQRRAEPAAPAVSASDAVEGFYDRLDAAANRMFDRLGK